MHRNLVFEIGTEELPARFIVKTLEQLKDISGKKLLEHRLEYESIDVYGTPRRLVLFVKNLKDKQTDLEEIIKGPSKTVAYDADTKPTNALLGFLKVKGKGASESDIFIKNVSGSEYVFVKYNQEGKDTIALLASILKNIITSISFPKAMRWGNCSLRFARPIRWIASLYGEETVDFDIEGIASGNLSKGHRTLSNNYVQLTISDEYFKCLENAYVIVDHGKRREIIVEQIRKIESELSIKVEIDEDLLNEVVFLVEYPTAFVGEFEKEFMNLPKEAVITPIKDHQRYFPVFKGDELLPYFVCVRNGNASYIEQVKKGNERVLRARLKDAQFFYNEDLKCNLSERVEELKRIVYQKNLGTIYEKVERFASIADFIAEKIGLDDKKRSELKRAAFLSKADLVTGLVNEFQELQGVMGKEYALMGGESEEIAEAIFSHYLPRFSGDVTPKDTYGMILSIADKMDTIIGSFSIGVQPTGSQDPFGLRRQCIGIISIILNNSLKIDLNELFNVAIKLLGNKVLVPVDSLKTDLEVFFKQRLRVIFSENGYRNGIIDSVFDTTLNNIFALKEKLAILDTVSKAEEFKTTITALSRAYSLSKKVDSALIAPKYFENTWEKNLYLVINELESNISKDLAEENFIGAINELKKVTIPINDFLDNVMVMVENTEIRNNRLALLKSIEIISKRICSFEKIIV